MRRRKSAIVAMAVLMCVRVACASAAAAPGAGAEDVGKALARFLTAFENLDWETFRASFDDDATVFFPAPGWPERSEGRQAYEARFRQVFDETRRDAHAGPPYQKLEPERLRIEMLGDGVALATFELRNAERLARRTIAFRLEAGVWRIVHLHASNMAR